MSFHPVFLLVVSLISTFEKTISVSSQADFDALSQRIHAALSDSPERLRVVFDSGTYRFHDDHISLFNENCPETELSLEGQDVRIVGSAPGLQSTPFFRLSRPVEIVDADQKLCRIKTRRRLLGSGQLFVQITSWYQLFSGPVVQQKDDYLYFTLNKLARSGAGYNVNGDFLHGRQMPRCRLLRVETGIDEVSTAFFKVTACKFRSLAISGITFVANADRRTEYAKDCLIRFYQAHFDKAVVENCCFRSIRTDVVHIVYSDHVEIRNCDFEGCYRRGVVSFNSSGSTRVLGNRFSSMGLSRENTPCVECHGTDYLVEGNRFTDYGNCAVAVGLHFSETMNKPVSGLVEDNEISQTRTYRKAAPMNLLMDTGAIYVWTQNSALWIQNNRIHDINGPGENRGIFCDDGTVNTVLEGNEVLRIANSYCIDLRRVLSVETRADSKIRRVNTGNRLGTNQVDGKIRFQQR